VIKATAPRRLANVVVAAATAIALGLGLSGCSTTISTTTIDSITSQIETALTGMGATGTVSDLTASCFATEAFIDAEIQFTYTETIAGQTLAVPVNLRDATNVGSPFDCHGTLQTDSLADDLAASISDNLPWRYQPSYDAAANGYLATVKAALAKTDLGAMNADAAFVDNNNNLISGFTPDEQQWFTTTASTNMASTDPDKKAFLGYYAITPQDALTHTLLTLYVTEPSIQASSYAKPDCATLKPALNAAWDKAATAIKQIDTTGFPDTDYHLAMLRNDATSSTDASDYVALSSYFHFTANGIDPTDAFDNGVEIC